MAKHWRTITVDGKTYRWRGKSYLVVQDENGIRVAEGYMHTVKGVSSDVFERGQWKKTTDGMIGPADIAAFIRNEMRKNNVA